MLTRKTLTQLLVVTILAITAKPLMAQAAYGESHPLRYRVIDVGTFGGATAQTNGSVLASFRPFPSAIGLCRGSTT